MREMVVRAKVSIARATKSVLDNVIGCIHFISVLDLSLAIRTLSVNILKIAPWPAVFPSIETVDLVFEFVHKLLRARSRVCVDDVGG